MYSKKEIKNLSKKEIEEIINKEIENQGITKEIFNDKIKTIIFGNETIFNKYFTLYEFSNLSEKLSSQLMFLKSRFQNNITFSELERESISEIEDNLKKLLEDEEIKTEEKILIKEILEDCNNQAILNKELNII